MESYFEKLCGRREGEEVEFSFLNSRIRVPRNCEAKFKALSKLYDALKKLVESQTAGKDVSHVITRIREKENLILMVPPTVYADLPTEPFYDLSKTLAFGFYLAWKYGLPSDFKLKIEVRSSADVVEISASSLLELYRLIPIYFTFSKEAIEPFKKLKDLLRDDKSVEELLERASIARKYTFFNNILYPLAMANFVNMVPFLKEFKSGAPISFQVTALYRQLAIWSTSGIDDEEVLATIDRTLEEVREAVSKRVIPKSYLSLDLYVNYWVATQKLREAGVNVPDLPSYSALRAESELKVEVTTPCNNEEQKPDLSDLYLENNVVELVKSAMKVTNVLLVGPPGVGKTSLAKRLAKAITGKEECYDIYTANSLWFRRHIIGGESIREGSTTWRSGILIRAYVKASRVKGNYYVIIDEINRADVDKAFGELLTIISSPNPNEWSIPRQLVEEIESYGNKIDKTAEEFLKIYYKVGDEPLRRLRFVATMNLVDLRNLFYVGEALLRRFVLVEIDYPSLDNLLKMIDAYNLTDKEKNEIKELVKCLRGKKVPVPPASLKTALHIYSNLGASERNVTYFWTALRSSIGTLNKKTIKKFELARNDCLKQ